MEDAPQFLSYIYRNTLYSLFLFFNNFLGDIFLIGKDFYKVNFNRKGSEINGFFRSTN